MLGRRFSSPVFGEELDGLRAAHDDCDMMLVYVRLFACSIFENGERIQCKGKSSVS